MLARNQFANMSATFKDGDVPPCSLDAEPRAPVQNVRTANDRRVTFNRMRHLRFIPFKPGWRIYSRQMRRTQRPVERRETPSRSCGLAQSCAWTPGPWPEITGLEERNVQQNPR